MVLVDRFFSGLGEWVRGAVLGAVEWLKDQALGVLEEVAAAVVSRMPEGVTESAEAVAPYIKAANHWAPITEAIILVGVWMMIWSAFVTCKLLLKLTPTIG